MKKIITSLFLVMGICCQVLAYDFVSGGIYYKITGSNTCKVTYATQSYNSYSGNVNIPSTVSNSSITYTVTEIDSGAFALCSALGSVTLPNTIVKIDSSAFVASSLLSINIPSSVRYIGSAAFGMTDITTITIPDSVQFLGGGMFWNCQSLSSITFNAINATHGRYYDLDLGDYAPNMAYCTSLRSVIIGQNVRRIPRAFFEGATSITNVVIPDNVQTVGDSAFFGCTSLSAVQIGSSVTSLGALAFASAGLTSINVRPTTPPTLGNNCFIGVSASATVTVPCSSYADYYYNNGWNYFNNITGGNNCTGNVVLTENNPQYGTTSGDGPHVLGTSVTIRAIPTNGYVFTQWNDNNTDNPRSFVITQDTSFTAIFTAVGGIDDAEGNRGMILVSTNSEILAYNVSEGMFEVYDMSGRMIASRKVVQGNDVRVSVPVSGVYVVRNSGRAIKVAVK